MTTCYKDFLENFSLLRIKSISNIFSYFLQNCSFTFNELVLSSSNLFSLNI